AVHREETEIVAPVRRGREFRRLRAVVDTDDEAIRTYEPRRLVADATADVEDQRPAPRACVHSCRHLAVTRVVQRKQGIRRGALQGSFPRDPHRLVTDAEHDIIAKLSDAAASAGLRRVAILAWRDLDDPEAGGSEVHAARVAALWGAAGIEVTLRTSHAPGHP